LLDDVLPVLSHFYAPAKASFLLHMLDIHRHICMYMY